MRGVVLGWLSRYLAGLRFPVLLGITAAALLLTLVVPDPFPLVDEVLLAVLTALLAVLTRRRPDAAPPRTHDVPGPADPPR